MLSPAKDNGGAAGDGDDDEGGLRRKKRRGFILLSDLEWLTAGQLFVFIVFVCVEEAYDTEKKKLLKSNSE